MARPHGIKTRGLSEGMAAVPQGPVFEGRFGRMFREQPVFDVGIKDLNALAVIKTQTIPFLTDSPEIHRHPYSDRYTYNNHRISLTSKT